MALRHYGRAPFWAVPGENAQDSSVPLVIKSGFYREILWGILIMGIFSCLK